MTDTAIEATLANAVRAWVEDDPDPITAAELTALLASAESGDAAASADLADRFVGLLQFGTAGLRGKIEGGPARMNRAVVIRAAAGLVRYLQDTLAGQERPPRIVIGYDARHRSTDFATDTAAIAQAAGLDVHIMPRPLPTPVLAFAVRYLDADAGVMVTASHNPPQDNGYKVYLGGRAVTDFGQGAQIVPPMDADIASRIAAVASAKAVERAESGWATIGEELIDEYVRLAALNAVQGPRDLRIVLTPLHGVGGVVCQRVLAQAGFTDVHMVELQEHPDPDFPTVAFPNPEEPGAIDLALEKAREVNADIVIANDPDADRCAVAVKDPLAGPATGGWRMLHGDEVGALLGEYMARKTVAAAALRGPAADTESYLANSIVSSRLLGRIAAAHGLHHKNTLTGFKWISRVPHLAYGYEEALGYCVDPAQVRDKDGISAAALIAQIAADLKAENNTIIGLLDELGREHGLHVSDQLSARFTDLSKIAEAVATLRANPPKELAGSPVVTVIDMSDGVDGLPPTDALVMITADDTRVIARPSGTEPKLKCYLEVIVKVRPSESVSAERSIARAKLEGLKSELKGILGL